MTSLLVQKSKLEQRFKKLNEAKLHIEIAFDCLRNIESIETKDYEPISNLMHELLDKCDDLICDTENLNALDARIKKALAEIYNELPTVLDNVKLRLGGSHGPLTPYLELTYDAHDFAFQCFSKVLTILAPEFGVGKCHSLQEKYDQSGMWDALEKIKLHLQAIRMGTK